MAANFSLFVAFVWSSLNAFLAPFALVGSDIEWKTAAKSGLWTRVFAILRGVAIAAPILVVFGLLFVAADAVYEGLANRVLNVMPGTVFTHILLFSVFSWFSAGYLRGVLIKGREPVNEDSETNSDPGLSPVDNVRAEDGEPPLDLPNHISILEHINISDPPDRKAERTADTKWRWEKIDNTLIPQAFRLGTIEIAVILGLINLLFLSFVIVQVPYLFGGMELIKNTPDLKLADYARRGFGELVVVAALVLPILMASHWLIKKEQPFAEKLFRALAGVQIGLLFIIMASAVQRLVLLTGNVGYGLTTIRLYPLIFMAWLVIVFVWFGVTVLRGSRQYFAWGALWSAFLVLGATHVLNPDALIVRTNIALMREGREFDAPYNSNLSEDAIPALMASFGELKDDQQKHVIRNLVRNTCENRGEDARSWNVSRWQAKNIIGSNERLVAAIGNCSSEMYGVPEREEAP